jgi:hypothetical protein
MTPTSLGQSSLVDLIDRILDKGLIINVDISISLVGVELLGIKLNAAIASFETAARYGLEFPSSTNLQLPVWENAAKEKELCPKCNKRSPKQDLLEKGCSWCGYKPACLTNKPEK